MSSSGAVGQGSHLRSARSDPTRSARLLRDAALQRSRSITKGIAIGSVAVVAALAAYVSHAFPGHSSTPSGNSGTPSQSTNSSSGASSSGASSSGATQSSGGQSSGSSGVAPPSSAPSVSSGSAPVVSGST